MGLENDNGDVELHENVDTSDLDFDVQAGRKNRTPLYVQKCLYSRNITHTAPRLYACYIKKLPNMNIF